jgi:hypothetical protein
MTDAYDHLRAQKDRIVREQAVQLAERIIEVLFTSGDKEVADRIALKQRISGSARRDNAGERDLGGWNREAATRQVLAVLLAGPAEETTA